MAVVRPRPPPPVEELPRSQATAEEDAEFRRHWDELLQLIRAWPRRSGQEVLGVLMNSRALTLELIANELQQATDTDVQRALIALTGRLRGDGAVKLLATRLDAPADPSVTSELIRALGLTGSAGAAALLLERAPELAASHRAVLIAALVRLAAREQLSGQLATEADPVRRSVVEEVLARLEHRSARGAQVLAVAREDAVGELVAQAGDAEVPPADRLLAIRRLAEADAVEPLVEMAGDPLGIEADSMALNAVRALLSLAEEQQAARDWLAAHLERLEADAEAGGLLPLLIERYAGAQVLELLEARAGRPGTERLSASAEVLRRRLAKEQLHAGRQGRTGR